jgi:mitogen-activated protein kinase kinase 9
MRPLALLKNRFPSRALTHMAAATTHVPAQSSTTPNAPANEGEELRLSDLEICYLGAGASGVVAKVRHRRTGVAFALKTAIDPDRDSDDQEDKALRRPARCTHVVRCHAVLGGPDDDVVSYVVELMDAGSLAGVLKKRGIPEPALAEAAARCLEAFAHIHAHGIACWNLV